MKKDMVKLVLIIAVIASTLIGCGKSYEERLLGAWYNSGQSEPEFVLYSDGTCDIAETSGTWSVVNDNIFKLNYTYYGLTKTFTINSLKDGILEMEQDGEEWVLYQEPTDEN